MRNTLLILFVTLTMLITSGCDNKSPEVNPYLEVTPNNIAGSWALLTFDGMPLSQESYVYIEFVRKDRTYKLFQNTDSAFTRVLTGTYNIYTDGEFGSVIRGNYDYDKGYWSHRYIIECLTETSMRWVAKDDPSNICVYVRTDIPQDIYSAYVPDQREEEE